MLLESRRGEKHRFETVRSSRANDSAKPAHCFTCRLSIVWEVVEPSLNKQRSGKPANYSPLVRSEIHYRSSSIVQISLCLSPIVK